MVDIDLADGLEEDEDEDSSLELRSLMTSIGGGDAVSIDSNSRLVDLINLGVFDLAGAALLDDRSRWLEAPEWELSTLRRLPVTLFLPILLEVYCLLFNSTMMLVSRRSSLM